MKVNLKNMLGLAVLGMTLLTTTFRPGRGM